MLFNDLHAGSSYYHPLSSLFGVNVRYNTVFALRVWHAGRLTDLWHPPDAKASQNARCRLEPRGSAGPSSAILPYEMKRAPAKFSQYLATLSNNCKWLCAMLNWFFSACRHVCDWPASEHEQWVFGSPAFTACWFVITRLCPRSFPGWHLYTYNIYINDILYYSPPAERSFTRPVVLYS